MGSGAWRERERGKINGLQILLVLVLDVWVGGKERDLFCTKIIPEQGTYLSERSSIMNPLYQSVLPNYSNIPVSSQPHKTIPNLFIKF